VVEKRKEAESESGTKLRELNGMLDVVEYVTEN
jgi:hypothetical protein